MPAHNRELSLTMTHIGTATAILELNGVRLLTDPFFSPSGSEFAYKQIVLKVSADPALSLAELPHIDGVLLSHEDHPDNLDDLGRRILDGRRVFTTVDGAKNLAPRPDIRGLKPWETVTAILGGKRFQITGTPCQHVPNEECTGFVVTAEEFGKSPDGRPNAIWFSGDTVYMDEHRKIREQWHITAAILNLGFADPGQGHPITMDGKSAVRIFRELEAEVLVPMHYEEWAHFTQFGKDLRVVFAEEEVEDKVCWLVPGEPKRVL